MAVVEGKVYAIGGWGYDRPEAGWESVDPTATGQDFSTVEAYEPKTDTWVTRADMPTARSHMAVSAVGGKIYVIGGGARIVAGRSGEWLRLLEVYDTATNRWSRAADMPTPRTVMSSSVVDGRIYVMGGVVSRGPASSTEFMRTLRSLSVVEVYDPERGRWTTARDLATSRAWFSTSVVDGKVYVLGGRSLGAGGNLDFESPRMVDLHSRALGSTGQSGASQRRSRSSSREKPRTRTGSPASELSAICRNRILPSALIP